MNNQDIHVVHLVDGLSSVVCTQEVRYKVVKLREISVSDEYAALQLAERVVQVNGATKLVVSDELYRIALTMRLTDSAPVAGAKVEQRPDRNDAKRLIQQQQHQQQTRTPDTGNAMAAAFAKLKS